MHRRLSLRRSRRQARRDVQRTEQLARRCLKVVSSVSKRVSNSNRRSNLTNVYFTQLLLLGIPCWDVRGGLRGRCAVIATRRPLLATFGDFSGTRDRPAENRHGRRGRHSRDRGCRRRRAAGRQPTGGPPRGPGEFLSVLRIYFFPVRPAPPHRAAHAARWGGAGRTTGIGFLHSPSLQRAPLQPTRARSRGTQGSHPTTSGTSRGSRRRGNSVH